MEGVKMNKTACEHCKKVNRRIFYAIMFFVLGACVFAYSNRALASNSSTEYSYAKVSITYSEENSQYGFRRDALYTETAHAHYYFESTITEALRQACMETTDSIVADLGIVPTKPAIYIFSGKSFNGVNIVGNSLYTCQNNWQDIDYVTRVILAAYGEGSHYGLAYGYAAILCERFGWETPELLCHSMPTILESYDLNLLCFDQRFVLESDIHAARQAACQFAKYLLETYNDDMVRRLLSVSQTDDGMAALSEKLGEYYSTKRINYSPSRLRFGYGGISYDYIVRSEFATFYIGTDWTDANKTLNPLITENFLHEDYKATRAFFERNLNQMERYQKLFDLGCYDNELTIIFPNSRKSSRYSNYQSGLHRIIVLNIDSLMHEYIHSLTKPKTSQNLWETEGFARYFSYYYDYYGIAFINEDYNTAKPTKATEYLFAFKQTINRPIDMQLDFRELENMAVYSRNYTDPNASYVADSSFIQYLVEAYGEAFVAQCIYGDNNLPKPYNELVNEWNQHIKETYSKLGSDSY